MIYRYGTLSLGILAALFLLFSQGVFAQDTVHVVVRGDTIFSLSRRYQVSQEELMRHNGITDASRIQVGMRLAIPGLTRAANTAPAATAANPAANTAPAYTHYLVSPNETLFRIAQNHGITVQALRDMNGFSRDRVLRAGERIRVPQTGTERPAATAAPAAPRPPATATQTRPAPAQPEPRRASLSVRWPVAAREAVYMNGKLPGVLLLGERHESIKSLTGGTVIAAGPYRGFGNIVIVETEGGYLYLYGVSETLSVRQGDRVEPGTELGKLGIYAATGRPELVFMVSRNGSLVDPVLAPRS